MKNNLHLFTLLSAIFLFISCSTEEVNQNDDLLGVWEKSYFDSNSERTLKLVFGTGNTGLEINSMVSKSGEKISNVFDFEWKVNDNKVTLIENDAIHAIYTLNSKEELVLNTEEDKILVKVSEDYMKYY